MAKESTHLLNPPSCAPRLDNESWRRIIREAGGMSPTCALLLSQMNITCAFEHLNLTTSSSGPVPVRDLETLKSHSSRIKVQVRSLVIGYEFCPDIFDLVLRPKTGLQELLVNCKPTADRWDLGHDYENVARWFRINDISIHHLHITNAWFPLKFSPFRYFLTERIQLVAITLVHVVDVTMTEWSDLLGIPEWASDLNVFVDYSEDSMWSAAQAVHSATLLDQKLHLPSSVTYFHCPWNALSIRGIETLTTLSVTDIDWSHLIEEEQMVVLPLCTKLVIHIQATVGRMDPNFMENIADRFPAIQRLVIGNFACNWEMSRLYFFLGRSSMWNECVSLKELELRSRGADFPVKFARDVVHIAQGLTRPFKQVDIVLENPWVVYTCIRDSIGKEWRTQQHEARPCK